MGQGSCQNRRRGKRQTQRGSKGSTEARRRALRTGVGTSRNSTGLATGSALRRDSVWRPGAEGCHVSQSPQSCRPAAGAAGILVEVVMFVTRCALRRRCRSRALSEPCALIPVARVVPRATRFSERSRPLQRVVELPSQQLTYFRSSGAERRTSSRNKSSTPGGIGAFSKSVAR